MMNETREEIILRDPSGNMRMVMHIKDGQPDGYCRWFDGKGEMITAGYFKEGKPWAGTFINWTRFFPSEKEAGPYDILFHNRDWVTVFESAHDSEVPDYTKLVEVYSKGLPVNRSMSDAVYK